VAAHDEQESPEWKQGKAAVGLGSSVGETAKAQDEWFAGVFVVLMHAGVKALGFCTELSMAATLWRPAVAREVVARAEEGSRGGEQDRDRARATRGGRLSRRWSRGSLHSGDGEVPCTGSSGGRAEQHVPEEEEERGGVRRTYVQN
jgi:hypothetical protein